MSETYKQITTVAEVSSLPSNATIFVNSNGALVQAKVGLVGSGGGTSGSDATALHFRGIVTSLPSNTSSYSDGDVIIVVDKEYVMYAGAWYELGDAAGIATNKQAIADLSVEVERMQDILEPDGQASMLSRIDALEEASETHVSEILVNGEAQVIDHGRVNLNVTADEIGGLATFVDGRIEDVSGVTVDTDTQYTITKSSDTQYKLMSKGKGDTAFTTEVAVIDLPSSGGGDSEALIELDTTLSVSGRAADAAAVGERIDEVEASIPTVPETLPNPHTLTINGTTYDGSEDVDLTIEAGSGGSGGGLVINKSYTLNSSYWQANGSFYIYPLYIAGMLETDGVMVDIVTTTSDPDLLETQLDAWSNVFHVTTGDDSVVFYSKIAISINLSVKIMAVR